MLKSHNLMEIAATGAQNNNDLLSPTMAYMPISQSVLSTLKILIAQHCLTLQFNPLMNPKLIKRLNIP